MRDKDSILLENAYSKIRESLSDLIKDVQSDEDEKYMEIDVNGNKIWRDENGLEHRDGDKPAVITAKGTRKWFQHGHLDREGDKPFLEGYDGTYMWFKNNLRHREGGKPAIVWADGTEEYFLNDKRYQPNTIDKRKG